VQISWWCCPLGVGCAFGDAVVGFVTAPRLSGRNAAVLLSVAVTSCVSSGIRAAQPSPPSASCPAVSGPQPFPAPPLGGRQAPSYPLVARKARAGGRTARRNLQGCFDSRPAPAAQARHSGPLNGAGNGKACGGRPAVNPRSAPTLTGELWR
jgi:hypothetical protein